MRKSRGQGPRLSPSADDLAEVDGRGANRDVYLVCRRRGFGHHDALRAAGSLELRLRGRRCGAGLERGLRHATPTELVDAIEAHVPVDSYARARATASHDEVMSRWAAGMPHPLLGRLSVDYELVDLKSFDVPLLTSTGSPAVLVTGLEGTVMGGSVYSLEDPV